MIEDWVHTEFFKSFVTVQKLEQQWLLPGVQAGLSFFTITFLFQLTP